MSSTAHTVTSTAGKKGGDSDSLVPNSQIAFSTVSVGAPPPPAQSTGTTVSSVIVTEGEGTNRKSFASEIDPEDSTSTTGYLATTATQADEIPEKGAKTPIFLIKFGLEKDGPNGFKSTQVVTALGEFESETNCCTPKGRADQLISGYLNS